MEDYTALWQLPSLPRFDNPTDGLFTMVKYFFALKQSQCTLPPTPNDSSKLAAFLEWTKMQQIQFNSCEYTQYFSTKEGFKYPGLIATQDIPKNHVYIQVKSECLITTLTAYHSPLKEFFVSYPSLFSTDNKDIAEDNILIAFLLHEIGKKEKSNWYPMLQMWPSEAGTLFTWNLTELKELQDDHAQWEALNDAYIIDEYYNEFYKAALKYPQFFPPEVMTKQMTYYLWDMLSSRIFSSEYSISMFSPFAETVNHDNVDSHYTTGNVIEKDSSESSDDDNTILCYSDLSKASASYGKVNYDEAAKDMHKPDFSYIDGGCSRLDKICEKPHSHRLYSRDHEFKKGQQVFMSYGKCANAKLLRNYGFCMEYNKYEHAEIPVGELGTEPNKIALFLKINGIKKDKKFIAIYNNIKVYYQKICLNLLSYVRVLLFDDVKAMSDYIDISSEPKILTNAIQLIQNRLKEYPTTLAFDLDLLKNRKTTSSKHYFAVLYRSEKKKILHHQIHLLRIVSEIVEKVINGAKWDDALKPTSIEKDSNEFNVKLSRKMIKNYVSLLRNKHKKGH